MVNQHLAVRLTRCKNGVILYLVGAEKSFSASVPLNSYIAWSHYSHHRLILLSLLTALRSVTKPLMTLISQRRRGRVKPECPDPRAYILTSQPAAKGPVSPFLSFIGRSCDDRSFFSVLGPPNRPPSLCEAQDPLMSADAFILTSAV